MRQLQKYLSVLTGLLRVRTFLLLVIYSLLGYAFGSYQQGGWDVLSELRFVIIIIVIGAWYINGTALNDFADYEIDKINLKKSSERPLLDNTISRKELIYVALGVVLFAILGSIYLGRNAIILTSAMILLNVAYSIKPIAISHRGVLAISLLPLGYVLYPVLLGIWANDMKIDFSMQVLTLILGLYLQFVSRIILKDFRDVKGDKKFGKKTFLLLYGQKVTCLISQITLVLGIIILFAGNLNQLKYSLIAIVMIAGYAFEMIAELSKQKSWKDQKAYITSYGRSLSGILVLVGLNYTFLLLNFQQLNLITVLTLVGILILYSAKTLLLDFFKS